MPGIAKLWKPVINVTDLDEGERFWSALSGLSPSGTTRAVSVLDADGPRRARRLDLAPTCARRAGTHTQRNPCRLPRRRCYASRRADRGTSQQCAASASTPICRSGTRAFCGWLAGECRADRILFVSRSCFGCGATALVAPRCRARWGRRVVSGPGVTCPKSRLLWGARSVTLDARVVPTMSSRARAGSAVDASSSVEVSAGCR